MKALLVFLAICVSAWPGSAQTASILTINANKQYLALGDSLAFGYNPLVQPKLSNYIGYPKLIAGAFDLSLSNASCPGETTNTFVGNFAAVYDGSAYYPGFSCAPSKDQVLVPYNGSTVTLTFFVPYNSNTPDQLAYASSFLKQNPNTDLVTIDVGLNDVGLVQFECANDASACPEELETALGTVHANLSTIFSTLRAADPGGAIIALDAFSFNYSPSNLTETEAISAYNSVVQETAAQYNVAFADLFPVFQTIAAPFGGDTCAAGVLVKLPGGTCDTHPNLLGQSVVAAVVLDAFVEKRAK